MTDLISIRPVNLPDEQIDLAEALCNHAAVLDVTSQQDFDEATRIIREVLTLHDRLEAERKFIVAPIDQEKKEVQAIFNPLLKRLKESADALKGRNRKFLNREKEAAPVAEFAPSSFEEALAVAPISAPDTIKAEETSYTTEWKWEIVDQGALPRALMIPNDKAIDNMVNTAKGATNIPGVRIWSEKRINYRRIR